MKMVKLFITKFHRLCTYRVFYAVFMFYAVVLECERPNPKARVYNSQKSLIVSGGLQLTN